MHIFRLTLIRFLGLAFAGLLFCACQTTSSSESEKTDSLDISDIFSDLKERSGIVNLAERDGTFDFTGTYTGTLPCADCAGIKTKILLTDSSYVKKTVYLGEGRPDEYEARGGASWDDDSHILTLGGIAPPNRYLVDDNTLTQLDRNGKKVTGRLASRYVLQKE